MIALTAVEKAKRAKTAVSIHLSYDRAEQLSLALADLLCWHRGYAAAKGDDTTHEPMGVDAARDINTMLKRAMEDVAS